MTFYIMYKSNCVFYIMYTLILPKRVLRNGVLVRGRDRVKVWIGTGTVLGIGWLYSQGDFDGIWDPFSMIVGRGGSGVPFCI